MSSNLLDRLGMAGVTQGIHRCVVINWFRIGVGRVVFGNVADLLYAAGAALLVVAVARAASRSSPVLSTIRRYSTHASGGHWGQDPALLA
jgi:hypothetical protein